MLTIYRASAGSGKTYTLAYEYIRLLLGHTDRDGRHRLNNGNRGGHRNILAITFTNKATGEMKRRIIHELALLAGCEPGWDSRSGYMEDLKRHFEATAEQIARAAREALTGLLFDFSQFQVSTIDSFFQTILRTFAREAELTGNYELTLEAAPSVSEGVARLFKSLEEDDSRNNGIILAQITRHLLNKMNEGKTSDLLNRSGKAYQTLVREISSMNDEDFATRHEGEEATAHDLTMEYLSDPTRLNRFASALMNEISALTRKAQLRATECLDAIERHGLGTGVFKANHFIKGLEKVKADPSSDSGATTVKPAAEGVESVLNKGRTLPPEVEASVIAASEAILTCRTRGKICRQLLDSTLSLSLMRHAMRYIDEVRQESNALLLDDTKTLLSRIIGDNDTPFVYERMGVWLNHFLIDEFQDTSRMQWDILRPLVEQGIAPGHDSLIIGDEKQCIYRFRNSDPTLLGSQVASDFGALDFQVKGNTPGSNTNWRSSATVVDFNNRLFEAMGPARAGEGVYGNVHQLVAAKNQSAPGYVEVERITPPQGSTMADEALPRMYDNIVRQLRAGYRPADIAILVRDGKDATQVAEYLSARQHDNPDDPRFGITSDESLRLQDSPAVKMIISALRLRSTTADDVRERRRSMREVTLLTSRFDEAKGRGLSDSDALEEAVGRRGEQAAESNNESWDMVTLVNWIIRERVPAEMACDQNAAISAFVDAVTEYSAANAPDPRSFLRWWDINGRRLYVQTPPDTMSVNLMTIHKSKGLQWACVHVPMVDWDAVSLKSDEWFPTRGLTLEGCDTTDIPPYVRLRPCIEMLATPMGARYQRRVREMATDETNVIYVAFTRAVNELCVYYKMPSAPKDTTAGEFVGHALMDAYGQESVTIGSHTSPPPREEKKGTALEPTASGEMPRFKAGIRTDLWNAIELDDDPEMIDATAEPTDAIAGDD